MGGLALLAVVPIAAIGRPRAVSAAVA